MTGRTQGEELIWGSDTTVSLPQPLEDASVNMIDMDGFCFTPTGLRLNISVADREELIQSGYGPRPGEEQVHE